MNTARILGSLALFALISILLSFSWLLLHNQSQSEYLIFIDFWFNYDSLAKGEGITQYLFHHVHTYAVVSLAWYLDVWLAGGSLRLFHTLQIGVIVAAFACLPGLALRLYTSTSLYHMVAIGTAVLAMSLWLSPSNSFGLTYPLVGFLASSLLLFLLVYAMVIRNLDDTHSSPLLWFMVCLVVATLGFFSFETFVVAPMFLVVDSLLRGRRREALLHTLITAFLLALYFVLRAYETSTQGLEVSPEVDYLAFTHNFLVFFSMHVRMALFAFDIDPGIAVAVTIAASAIQLSLLLLFALSHYFGNSRSDLSTRFAFMLVVVGATSIALATWLRFPDEIVTIVVRRYTPYAIMISMGALFLSVRVIISASGHLLRAAALVTLMVSTSYVLADTFALWSRSYNAAASYAHTRLEMPLYAVVPGDEALYPPGSHEGYAPIRKRVHPFLKKANLSVFGNPGYLAMGQSLPPLDSTPGASCTLMWEGEALYNRPQYTMASFRVEGIPGDGIFLVADPQGAVAAFGLSARLHPLQRNMQSLLPKTSDGRPLTYYYAPVSGTEVATVIPCAGL